MPKVLHAKSAGRNTNETQVYIGRPSKWGNPFKIGIHGTREEVVHLFEEWLLMESDIIEDIEELKGKNLVCFCAPKLCHGDILLKYAND